LQCFVSALLSIPFFFQTAVLEHLFFLGKEFSLPHSALLMVTSHVSVILLLSLSLLTSIRAGLCPSIYKYIYIYIYYIYLYIIYINIYIFIYIYIFPRIPESDYIW
jgi:hypothetical protein